MDHHIINSIPIQQEQMKLVDYIYQMFDMNLEDLIMKQVIHFILVMLDMNSHLTH